MRLIWSSISSSPERGVLALLVCHRGRGAIDTAIWERLDTFHCQMQSPTKAEDSLQFILDVICKEKLQRGVGKAGEYLADNPKKWTIYFQQFVLSTCNKIRSFGVDRCNLIVN